MARTKTPANVVGPQVRKLRNKLDLTQEELAARCQLHGLDISRGTLSQIEARLRRVADSELFRLSAVLNVSTDDLFPSDMRKERDKLRTRQGSGG
ncbi:MAG: helix-turn-helix domain-containing protein [Limisphaerales bacterium]|jgi:transcriptional regulator with XRE-family HTH domain